MAVISYKGGLIFIYKTYKKIYALKNHFQYTEILSEYFKSQFLNALAFIRIYLNHVSL